jgi:hypothetical protein
MNRWYKGTLFLLAVYTLYLAKSAAGINISQRYSLWSPFKFPIQGILDARTEQHLPTHELDFRRPG